MKKEIVNGKCKECGTPWEVICRCEVAQFRDNPDRDHD